MLVLCVPMRCVFQLHLHHFVLNAPRLIALFKYHHYFSRHILFSVEIHTFVKFAVNCCKQFKDMHVAQEFIHPTTGSYMVRYRFGVLRLVHNNPGTETRTRTERMLK